MNPDWMEGKLELDFSGAIQPIERPEKHAKTLKSVDFIGKYSQELWLIEVKDPEEPLPPHQAESIKDAVSRLQNDSLLKEHFLPKLYGTFVYLVQENREPRGRVRYVILIGLSTLSAADRSVHTDRLQRIIDRIGPKIRHSKYWPVAEVHNIESWNRTHPDKRVTRHP